MPRQARLDAPGVLHQVVVGGVERRARCRDDVDGAEFVEALRHALPASPARRGPAALSMAAIIERVCARCGFDPGRLHGGRRKRVVSAAREGIAY